MLDWLKIDPVAFAIPIGEAGFPIYWYGIIITIGIVIGAIWAGREIERRGQSVDDLYNGLLLVVLVGYLFARLWYVFQDAVIAGNSAAYTSFLDVINLRAGGANILGGFVGAVFVGWIYMKIRRLNFWHYADVAGPTILIAQGIGRWGNFINQELYGPPTTLPWGILIDRRVPPYTDLTQYPVDTRFHPTFLYESLLLLIGFFVLIYLNRRFRDQWKPGTLFGVFLIWWGAERAFIEFFRPDQPALGETAITYSMLFALGIAIAGILVLFQRYKKLPVGSRKRRVRRPKPQRQAS